MPDKNIMTILDAEWPLQAKYIQTYFTYAIVDALVFLSLCAGCILPGISKLVIPLGIMGW